MQLQFPEIPEEFTKAEQKIIDYITCHPDAFLFMTIGQFSECLSLSDATLSRFARHVGCRDFKELKQVVMQQTKSGGPVLKMAGTLSQSSGFAVQSWLLRQQQYLQKTIEQTDPLEFELAAQAVLKARRIYIHAKSASFSLGQLLLFRLRRLGFWVTLLPSGGSEVLEGLAHAGEGDLVIMFSFLKVSAEGRMILDYRGEAGYQTVAFTSRAYAPPEHRADINLFVYRGEENEYHSMSVPAAMVDALAIALSEKLGSKSSQRLGLLHKLKRKYSDMK